MRMGDMMWPDSPLTDVDTCDSIVNHCLILYIIYNIYTVAVGWNYCCYCVDSISNKMMWDEMMCYNKCARRKPNREKPRKTSKQVLYGCGVFEVHVHSQFLDLHLFECQIFWTYNSRLPGSSWLYVNWVKVEPSWVPLQFCGLTTRQLATLVLFF